MKQAARCTLIYGFVAIVFVAIAIGMDYWLSGCIATFAAYMAVEHWLELRKMEG